MSFYGDPTINSLFQFDKIYSSRKDMDDAIADGKSDEVFLNRYVLVKYDENNYENCRKKDETNYKGNIYDRTIWKKVSEEQVVKYELIANLIPSSLVWYTF